MNEARSRTEALERAWDRAVASLGLVMPIGPPSGQSPGQVHEELRALFRSAFPADSLARFEFPQDLLWWLAGPGQQRWLFGSWMLAASDQLGELTDESRWVDDTPATTALWVAFGTRGDTHHFCICCDRDSEDHGRVVDFHDTHPWLVADADRHEQWRDLLAFLNGLADL